jgi:hypothetical protein
MIITPHPKGWRIIYQRAHGQLAAEIGANWNIIPLKVFPYYPFIISLAEHDDGIQESRHPECLTQAGAPKDFKLLPFVEEQYRNVIELSLAKSRWNALIISKHLSFLYENEEGKDEKLKAYLADQNLLQKKLCKELKIKKSELEHDYAIFQWCDALSLIFCQNLTPPESRKLEISKGPKGESYFIWKEEETYFIDPFPFEGQLNLELEYRIIDQLVFKNADELDNKIKNTPPQVQKFNVRSKD